MLFEAFGARSAAALEAALRVEPENLRCNQVVPHVGALSGSLRARRWCIPRGSSHFVCDTRPLSHRLASCVSTC